MNSFYGLLEFIYCILIVAITINSNGGNECVEAVFVLVFLVLENYQEWVGVEFASNWLKFVAFFAGFTP